MRERCLYTPANGLLEFQPASPPTVCSCSLATSLSCLCSCSLATSLSCLCSCSLVTSFSFAASFVTCLCSLAASFVAGLCSLAAVAGLCSLAAAHFFFLSAPTALCSEHKAFMTLFSFFQCSAQ